MNEINTCPNCGSSNVHVTDTIYGASTITECLECLTCNTNFAEVYVWSHTEIQGGYNEI
jgi:hypothetical protein